MNPQPGKQILAMHILPNISRSNNNQTMKFCQLMNMGNIFLKKIIHINIVCQGGRKNTASE